MKTILLITLLLDANNNTFRNEQVYPTERYSDSVACIKAVGKKYQDANPAFLFEGKYVVHYYCQEIDKGEPT